MEVFQAVKDALRIEKKDVDIPPHFSLESMPATEAELIARNAYLLKYGITPIWFPTNSYEYIEQILRLARNEMKYRGHLPGVKKEVIQEQINTVPVVEKPNGLMKILGTFLKNIGV